MRRRQQTAWTHGKSSLKLPTHYWCTWQIHWQLCILRESATLFPWLLCLAYNRVLVHLQNIFTPTASVFPRLVYLAIVCDNDCPHVTCLLGKYKRVVETQKVSELISKQTFVIPLTCVPFTDDAEYSKNFTVPTTWQACTCDNCLPNIPVLETKINQALLIVDNSDSFYTYRAGKVLTQLWRRRYDARGVPRACVLAM